MLRIHYRIVLVLLFSAVAFAFGAPATHATTYIVGTCKTGTTFSTIQDALNALPAPNMVEVCPGIYDEQVTITKPVTLEGIVSSGYDQAIIGVPSGGLKINATDDTGASVAAQVLVQDVADVDISNLVIDGSGNKVSGSGDFVVGIFYRNSAGTIEHVVTRNQFNNLNGIGIELQGGSSNPTVTVEDSSIHDFDNVGIYTQTDSTSSELTAKIEGNVIAISDSGSAYGLLLLTGSTVTATDNYVKAGEGEGFVLSGAAGSVTGNTTVTGDYSVYVEADADISIKSNKFLDSSISAIVIAVNTTLTEIQGNTLTKGITAISFGCRTTNAKVHSNTIIDFPNGLTQLPSGTTSANTYYDVGTESTTCP
ncbi:MAG: right-handed parallel beta-helix repeat-containing protein [Candidatus Acidiferrales bacterium]